MSIVILVLACSAGFISSAQSDYLIVSPYKDVVWSGDNAWGAYRGTLHTHTTYSDAQIDLASMIKEYYRLGYDFVANADHAVTGIEWNKTPAEQPIYLYQRIIGKKIAHLTDEEFIGMTNGTYENRGKKMTCVVGANELNNLSLSKNHVNGYFLPSNVGNGFGGIENEAGFEKAIKFVEKNGGLSHINHPGDWIESNKNPQAVNDPKNIKLFGDLLLKYDSCLGIEALNENNGTEGYTRVLWDNLLMYCLPYGKNVLGFGNTDAHELRECDSSFNVFMMEENNVDNIKKTMQSGAFFAVTRALRANDFEIGPKEAFDVRGKEDIKYPMFTSLTVDGHKITASAADAKEIQWIANGKVIKKLQIGTEPVVLDFDTIEGAKDFAYVRAEILGDGGLCMSQAFVIDNGTAPKDFTQTKDANYYVNYLINLIKCTKFYTIIQEIIYRID